MTNHIGKFEGLHEHTYSDEISGWKSIFVSQMIAFEETTKEKDKPAKRPLYIMKLVEDLLRDKDEAWKNKIKEGQWQCGIHGLPKYEKTDCKECNEALEINVVLNNLITTT